MRGIAFVLVSVCLLALTPESAHGTSAYAGVRVSPHDSVHASASGEASAPEAGCSITGGRATLSVTYIGNPVPFGKVDAAVLVGHAQPELAGSGCALVTGTFNEYPCAPAGTAECRANMGATTVTMFTTIPIDVEVTASGLAVSGEPVQDTASCTMTFQAFAPPPSCDLT